MLLVFPFQELDSAADRRVHMEKVTESIFKLIIDDSDIPYTGTYKVQLSNSAGSVDATAKGTVKGDLYFWTFIYFINL